MPGKELMKHVIHVDPGLFIDDVEDVLNLPIVIRVNEFDEEDVEDFDEKISQAHSTLQPIIPVVIDSYGGDAYGCLGMISAIENSRKPVATIITTKAMSAGALLFSFGTEGHRYMDPHAQLMLHGISSSTGGNVDDMKADIHQTEHLNTMLYKRMAKHLGHPENYFLNLLDKHKLVDIYLTAKEAKKHLIANHLKVPCFDISVKLGMSFQ